MAAGAGRGQIHAERLARCFSLSAAAGCFKPEAAAAVPVAQPRSLAASAEAAAIMAEVRGVLGTLTYSYPHRGPPNSGAR